MSPRPALPRLLRPALLAGAALAAWIPAIIDPSRASAGAPIEEPAAVARPLGAPDCWRLAWTKARREQPGFDATLPIPQLDAPDAASGASRERLRAGERVTLRWRPLVSRVVEFEVLLSIDGGRTFRLRVTPDLHATETRWVWTVPNIDARDARIRIRARLDGREVEGPSGPAFTIEPDVTRPRERWLYHDRGWLDESLGGSAAPARLAPRPGRAELRMREELDALEAPSRVGIASVTLGSVPVAHPGPPPGRVEAPPLDPSARFHPRRE